MKHLNDMDREELRDLVSAMSWAALDLKQHLQFTIDMLKDEYKENAYKKACKMAYDICQMPYQEPKPKSNFDISLFGEDGLTKL